MKALVIALALILTSVAHAETSVLASVVTSGGMMAPGTSNTHKIEILSNGQVIATTPTEKGRVIAKLALSVVNGLKTSIEAMPNSVKLEADPKKMRCMDAPGTSYSVTKENGKVVLIGGISQCVELESPDYVPFQYEIVNALKGLSSLAGF